MQLCSGGGAPTSLAHVLFHLHNEKRPVTGGEEAWISTCRYRAAAGTAPPTFMRISRLPALLS